MGKNENGMLKALKFAGAAAGTIYAAEKMSFYLATVRNMLKPDSGSIYNWKFGNIFYHIYGEGSPVVLVHDLRPDCCGCEWKDFAVRILRGHRIYVLDMPGYGRSEKKNVICTGYYYAKAINDFIDNVVGDTADVISSGRASSAVIMARYAKPDNFGRLIFINPETPEHMYRGTDEPSRVLGNLIEMPLIGTGIYTCLFSYPAVAARFRHEYFKNEGCVSKTMIRSFTEAAHLNGSGARFTLSSHIAGYDACDALAMLRKMQCEAMIVGGRDLPGIDRTIEAYRSADPAIISHMVRNTCAMPHMEAPSAVGKVCCDYLRKSE